jgi:diguanylate cyclase (GGDEF)-like protein
VSSDLTLGVLSPFLGGWYFGSLLRGIARSARQEGAAVVALQTLDAGTEQVETREAPDPRYPVAWGHAAGFIVIINAVNHRYIAAIQAAGKPVVKISHEEPGVDCPIVLPDNRTGIREAVAHLVWHGHRRIAFAGYLDAKDVLERYEAYRQALTEHGITPDPRLFFPADDNIMSGGVAAARAMIDAGLPATAVIVGTDANAISLMQTLTDAGCRLPDDQAVVGFDDQRGASYTMPRLTTVNHPVDMVGRTAVATLMRQIHGEHVPSGRLLVPTSLVVRESCGCPRRDPPELAAMPPFARLEADGRAHFGERMHLQETLSKQYEVSMELLRSHERDPRRLQWLERTPARAGCLGLWTDRSTTDPSLDPVGLYPQDEPSAAAGGAMPASDFPPVEVLDAARTVADMVAFVVPVKADGSDWGLLAVVDRVETRVGTGREPISHWAALLTVALDHQKVLAALRDQEEQLRVAALYDHLTGLPNRTLFLDRLSQALRRRDHDFAVLFVDLDGFKVINDSLGHAAGDRMLTEVADRITASLRESDTGARFGGDEFLILLTDARTVDVDAVRRCITETLASPIDLPGARVNLGASIGIAVAHEPTDPENLINQADHEMYRAKRA